MAFNENTRVKIPAILHLTRLGYTYLPLSSAKYDEATNIFTELFSESIKRINPGIKDNDVKRLFEKVSLALDNEDLGQAFYEMLTSSSGTKLIDFTNYNKNSFHVVTELTYKNGNDEFRPDITLLVNGMPLAFVEVKKPNNQEGVLAERDRINVRFKNKKFRKFINLSQILVFSNNMEYDQDSIEPIQGAFYSAPSYKDAAFNCFREKEGFNLTKILKEEDDDVENLVLKDNNLTSIKYSPEFKTNKQPDTPTNRILTSLFSKDRFGFLLKYCIAYVRETNGIEKHIMRYQQFFATRAIREKIDGGVKRGIIWHTQGSGKTALAYYNVKYLTDYFQSKGVIPKFYFIVDRLDLLTQAKSEFSMRGLIVNTVNSKEELQKNFRAKQAIFNPTGQREITVVNIQKFKEDTSVLQADDYDINTQRVYFLDEVHRSYNPKGSFLANLYSSDRKAILIGLTGTPLIKGDRKSRDIFGDYIHKYYYNDSIADGYTLRLIREGIETSYKIQLEKALQEIEIQRGNLDRREVYAHEKFAEPMMDYIVDDFLKSRVRFGDNTIGGMVVCDSSEQARKLNEIFQRKYANGERWKLSASLILHDEGSTDDRKEEVDNFKDGKVDLLFVYNMLLTGFDAKRLKKLYVGRQIKDHNLLQTLTRVNRPYKNFRYGFVVDFADIRKEFEATNKAYFDELQEELGDEFKTYSNLFLSKEEIEKEIKVIKEILFRFDLENAENFSKQITEIDDRKEVLKIKKALENAKNIYNLIRIYEHKELLNKLDFKKLHILFGEASRHLDLLNFKENLKGGTESANLLNVALEDVIFAFRKVSEKELIISDQLKDTLRKTREAMNGNYDKKDPGFVSLLEELKHLFENKNLNEISQEDMKRNIDELQKIYDMVSKLNRTNDLLRPKYNNDPKYVRIHKRIVEKGTVSKKESEIYQTLMDIKKLIDEKVLNNTRMLQNESYFQSSLMPLILTGFEKAGIALDADTARFIDGCIAKEYMDEYQGVA